MIAHASGRDPAASESRAGCTVEFCGQYFPVTATEPFAIGREGPLGLDDNPYLHRRFLEVVWRDGWWWVCNVGSRLAATTSASDGVVHAWLTPGGRLPLVFREMHLVFTAGPTTYEVIVHTDTPTFLTVPLQASELGATTVGNVPLTVSQRALIVSLAEPLLARQGVSPGELPSSAQAAARLGWTMTQFNRKLDNVCGKFARAGVRGLRGEVGQLATNRRVRLVEYALTTRLVTPADLSLLDGGTDVGTDAS